MKREDFLNQLMDALADLSASEKEDVRAYFDELIQDKAGDSAATEDDVIASLGTVSDIAREVRDSALQGRTQQIEAPAPDAASTARPQAPGIKVMTARADQVRDVLIHVHNQKVDIQAGNADEVVLRFEESENYRMDFSLEDGHLRLEQTQPIPWSLAGLRQMFAPSSIVTLTVPADFAAQLQVQTSNNRITMSGVELWGDLKLKTSNAKMSVARCAAREMDLRTSNGKVILEDLRAKRAISLHTSNGSIQCDRAVCEGALSLRTSNGRIGFSGLDAATLTLTTSNSAVAGALPHPAAAYSVTSGTTNAGNNLRGHDHQGQKQLVVRTSNGAIKVEFQD